MNTNNNGIGSWMPIESAPKDQYILLCLDGRDWSIGCWNRNLYDSQSHIGDWVNDDGTESTPFMLKPTHWMPLPKLPNANCPSVDEKRSQ